MAAGSTNSNVDALWAQHAAAVRRQLLKHGVTPTDLDDVVQKTAHGRARLGDELANVQHPEVRLREVSRRVAAGYRRRAYRRREVAYGEPPEIADASDADVQLAEHQDVERLSLLARPTRHTSRPSPTRHGGWLSIGASRPA